MTIETFFIASFAVVLLIIVCAGINAHRQFESYCRTMEHETEDDAISGDLTGENRADGKLRTEHGKGRQNGNSCAKS